MFLYVMMNLLSVMIMIIVVLVGIGFITLLERKILGLIQNRKGPNKLGMSGIFQPFSDGIKLFSKEMVMMNKMNLMLFYFSSLMFFFNMFMLWTLFSYYTNIYFMNYSMLIIIMILGLNSYVGMIIGWSSSSLYSMIGSIRLVVQILSYEVSFIMILFVEMVLSESYVLIEMVKWQYYLWFIWLLLPMGIVFFISMLAELNRSPMDLVEGESELVSGFNVEYFSSLFGLIYMGEYGMIIFMGYMMMFLFLGVELMYLNFIIMMVVIYLIIFFRGILPRMRYDELMYLCWKIILPLVLNYIMMVMIVKIILMYLV